MPQLSLHSPVGDLTVFEDAGAIVAVEWGWVDEQTPTALLRKAKTQLEHYFDTGRSKFDLPLKPAGTTFQKKVWAQMQKIPTGKTRSYGDVAQRLKSSPRAVGGACGRNPIPVIIPCHRILAAHQQPGGFSGGAGVDTKLALLQLEGVIF